ncbi:MULTISPECIES: immunity 49 family protein [unclassified Streptomyces]|uniref:immunity 49 family protein n=1 Tax=unclassified Streptomyces TaxID=2593676 RepID=UPI00224C8225|nr:immunity 49 family protein [Streptomyces sp. NBC_00047]MCX5607202.1 immunity 49 family protein [Streptomyces sp. NBC_00047]
MTASVHRHAIPGGPDAEQFAERLGERMARRIDSLEESTGVIDFAFNSSLLALRARCVIDPRAAAVETWEAMVNAMQLGSALFAVTGVSEGSVECRINRKLRTLPAVGPLPPADAGNWLTAFWLAVICRDQTRMTQLCEIPLDRLRSPEGQYDEYVYHWVDVLQTYWLQRPGLVDKLIATIEASNPEVVRVAPRDLLQGVLYPPINLFYHFVRKDEAGFSPALADALKLHKAYWTLNEDRKADIDGTIALGPLAIACLAHDGKIPIEVESDYLPKHLLQRSWGGEFPT